MQASSPQEQQAQRCRLLELPLELRAHIYYDLLHEEKPADFRSLIKPQALAQTCHQLFQEVAKAFFAINDIGISICLEPRSGMHGSAPGLSCSALMMSRGRGTATREQQTPGEPVAFNMRMLPVPCRTWLRMAQPYFRLLKLILDLYSSVHGDELASVTMVFQPITAHHGGKTWQYSTDWRRHTVRAPVMRRKEKYIVMTQRLAAIERRVEEILAQISERDDFDGLMLDDIGVLSTAMHSANSKFNLQQQQADPAHTDRNSSNAPEIAASKVKVDTSLEQDDDSVQQDRSTGERLPARVSVRERMDRVRSELQAQQKRRAPSDVKQCGL